MSTSDKATARPWYAGHDSVNPITGTAMPSVGNAGYTVAAVRDYDDAAFIVRAVNAHDALVAALSDAEFLLRKLGQLTGPMQDSCNRSADDARTTLALARA